MKILVCGEGAHDIGEVNIWSIRDRNRVSTEGWVQCITRAFCGDAEIIAVPRARLVSLPGRAGRKPLPKGHGAKALIARFRATTEQCDVLVFMIDADTTSKREWKKKRAEILAGFQEMDSPVQCVACVPMSTSESWLLSDPEAWKSASQGAQPDLPARPEELWGRKADPASNHPHVVFARICDLVGLPDTRDTRITIAGSSGVDAVMAKCPVSFGAFAADLKAAQEALAAAY